VTTPGGQAGTQEEAISKAKQSRSEKKARKALSKLGLQRRLFILIGLDKSTGLFVCSLNRQNTSQMTAIIDKLSVCAVDAMLLHCCQLV